MSVAFWSTSLKPGKPIEVQPPEGYVLNLQNASIHTTNANATNKNTALVIKVKTTSIEGDDLESVIGSNHCFMSLNIIYSLSNIKEL